MPISINQIIIWVLFRVSNEHESEEKSINIHKISVSLQTIDWIQNIAILHHIALKKH